MAKVNLKVLLPVLVVMVLLVVVAWRMSAEAPAPVAGRVVPAPVAATAPVAFEASEPVPEPVSEDMPAASEPVAAPAADPAVATAPAAAAPVAEPAVADDGHGHDEQPGQLSPETLNAIREIRQPAPGDGEVIEHPDGTKEVKLGNRFRSVPVATVGPDGKVRVNYHGESQLPPETPPAAATPATDTPPITDTPPATGEPPP